MELKRKWATFYHRLASWRTHKLSGLTEGKNLRQEILQLIDTAEKEIIIVELAVEPIFRDDEFYQALYEKMSQMPEIQATFFLFDRQRESEVMESITKNLESLVISLHSEESGYNLALYRLNEHPYLLFYLCEKELLLKDVEEANGKSISLKFKGENIFEKDCRDYVKFLQDNPSVAVRVFPATRGRNG
ncbi:MAG: hypothetical protein N2246_07580 [Candidatus Sumerlaeia bacterium]|nr:hypothetical protein [Candidatus Sumerlaeia bacterium]